MKLSGERNQCPSCSLYFKSNTAFSKHRTGKHGVDRRCMTTEEMTVSGMPCDEKGWWSASAMSTDLKEYFENKESLKHEQDTSDADRPVLPQVRQ